MGNIISRVDIKDLPQTSAQCIDVHSLRSSLSKWTLEDIKKFRNELLHKCIEEANRCHTTAEVKWPTFFASFQRIADSISCRLKTKERRVFHSSCTGYTMKRKTRKLDNTGKLLPDGSIVSDQRPFTDSNNFVNNKKSSEPKWINMQRKTQKNEEKQKLATVEEIQQLAHEHLQSMSEPSDNQVLSEISNNAIDSEQVQKTTVVFIRSSWNPIIFSPVFFGYETTKISENTQKTKEGENRTRDSQIFWDNIDIDRKEAEVERLRATCQGKYKSYVEAQDKLTRQRKLASAKRYKARKEMEQKLASDPPSLKSYIDEWTNEERKIIAQENADHKGRNPSTIPELQRLYTLRKELSFMIEEKAYLHCHPCGEHLQKKYKELYNQRVQEKQKVIVTLKEVQQTLKNLKTKSGTPKGVIIMTEGDVHKAQV